MTIWKFPLAVTDSQSFVMRENATFLSVSVQFGVPCLWVLVDPDSPRNERTIRTWGTGHDIPHFGCGQFIGTYQLQGGHLIYHVFAEPTP